MDSRSPSSSFYSSNSGRRSSCLCAPTTHPGSFRCSFHRNTAAATRKQLNRSVNYSGNSPSHGGTPPKARTTARAVLLKKIIAPNSGSARDHLRRRRRDFQPKPSRFQSMSVV
ncbi:uncharacterized protein LOC122031617 [Zingiber officinale]|uniref:Serine-rich protein-like protein n=1 Tax=Zingiber officinale TaxID=94328 RepID=A0A8J5CV93_ZINOF|nr:uncharacterized protein LOC122031617 [Zingiber officinale]KAG6471126.1 hypothetical protein ZIOFF_072223 [Zingiber officinale]